MEQDNPGSTAEIVNDSQEVVLLCMSSPDVDM